MTTSGALIVAPRSPMTRPSNASSSCSSGAGRTGVMVMTVSCSKGGSQGVRPGHGPENTTHRRGSAVRIPSSQRQRRQPGPISSPWDRSARAARIYSRNVLRLWLCGRLAGARAGEPLAMPAADRARALIGWLALNPGQHPRAVVAARLWPEVPQDTARASLRTAVWSLRQCWGAVADEVLEASRTSLGWRDGEVWVDALADPLEHAGELLPGI